MRTSLHFQNGFSLVEVLVAWFIASIVLLGALAMQMQALRDLQTSRNNVIAATQLFSLSEMYRSSSQDAFSNQDMADWLTQFSPSLSEAHIQNDCGIMTCHLQLYWQQSTPHHLNFVLSG